MRWQGGLHESFRLLGQNRYSPFFVARCLRSGSVPPRDFIQACRIFFRRVILCIGEGVLMGHPPDRVFGVPDQVYFMP